MEPLRPSAAGPEAAGPEAAGPEVESLRADDPGTDEALELEDTDAEAVAEERAVEVEDETEEAVETEDVFGDEGADVEELDDVEGDETVAAAEDAGVAGEATAPVGRAPWRPRLDDSRFLGPFVRLYRGQTSFDFVGRRRWWFLVSGVIIVAGILSLSIRGFNFGIDFKGGTSWTVLAPGVNASQAQSAVQSAGVSQPVVEVLGGKTVEVQADLNTLPKAQQASISSRVVTALARLAHTTPSNVSSSHVGPTWGGQVTNKAAEALIAFFVVVAIYISLRFEWKMAVAALIAVVHDLLVTAGVYSLSGLQVTPDTVIAVLTILGYSLYDTVVVFDRVRENAKSVGSTGRMTYSDMVNLSMNQTLARSINTSLVAVLPVLAVLLIGAEILGATTLQEFGLALFIGLVSGAYSSIFIASPVLAMLKELEPRYRTIRQRLATRGDRLGVLTPSAAAALASGGTLAGGRGGGQRAGGNGMLRPGSGGTARGGNGRASQEPSGGAADAVAAGAFAARGAAGGGPAVMGAQLRAGGGRSATGRPPPRPRRSSKSKKRRR